MHTQTPPPLQPPPPPPPTSACHFSVPLFSIFSQLHGCSGSSCGVGLITWLTLITWKSNGDLQEAWRQRLCKNNDHEKDTSIVKSTDISSVCDILKCCIPSILHSTHLQKGIVFWENELSHSYIWTLMIYWKKTRWPERDRHLRNPDLQLWGTLNEAQIPGV